MKKGQMEVVGLLVIVILLLVIGVFVLKFSLQPASSTTADARSSLESTRLLQALVLTTIQGKSVAEYAAACSRDTGACQNLRLELESIFSVILRKGQQYSFSLLYQDQKILVMEHCSVGVLSSYLFISDGGFYEVQLRLCSAVA